MALEFLRRHHQRKSLFLTIPLIIIVLSFVALYFPSLQGAATGSRSQEVGRVGSLPITLGEFQSAYSNRRRFYEQAYRGQVDERMLRAMGLENQVFEGLVSQKLLELEAQRLGIVVDDAAVAKAIAEDPNLQRDGKFVGREELLRLLALQGVAPDDFTEQQRQRLVIERLRAIVAAGASVSPAEAEDEYRRRNEQLKAEYVQVSAQPFRAAANVSDDEVRQRFAAKQDHYAIPEKRVVAALLIDPSALRAGITVPDTETNRYYEEHRSEFIEPEQACASHILVRVKSGDGDAEGHADADARKIADDVLAKAKAGGDFAALAKKSSEDKGSATNGGDLGCFPAGRMLPEFDNAAFGLASGQLSDVVKTSYGYHVIRMNERKAESVPAMSAVKEQIAARLVCGSVVHVSQKKK
jgi:peptidyl-prolyl cis-trans isomerase D